VCFFPRAIQGSSCGSFFHTPGRNLTEHPISLNHMMRENVVKLWAKHEQSCTDVSIFSLVPYSSK
jgi:hypothetical protein